jgi:hypothetical protein
VSGLSASEWERRWAAYRLYQEAQAVRDEEAAVRRKAATARREAVNAVRREAVKERGRRQDKAQRRDDALRAGLALLTGRHRRRAEAVFRAVEAERELEADRHDDRSMDDRGLPAGVLALDRQTLKARRDLETEFRRAHDPARGVWYAGCGP